MVRQAAGIGTLVTELAKDNGLAAKGLLRHSNVATTQTHYIKDVPVETEWALQLVEQLFAENAPSGVSAARETVEPEGWPEDWPEAWRLCGPNS
jgi:hypothetical protein